MSSELKLYAVGTVAEDLIVGNKSIKVQLHEIMNNIDGEIGNDNNISSNVKSSDGKVYSVNMNSSGTVPAVWLKNNSNRVTPPNVRKGEKVEVWRLGSTDKYYWKTMSDELDLRKLEHVKWVFVNTKVEGETRIDDSNSYSFTISTLNKLVSLKTAENDGEFTSYKIELDTKEGVLEIIDGRGNFLKLNSRDDGFTINTNNKVDIISTNEANVITKTAVVKADTLTIQTNKTSINP